MYSQPSPVSRLLMGLVWTLNPGGTKRARGFSALVSWLQGSFSGKACLFSVIYFFKCVGHGCFAYMELS